MTRADVERFVAGEVDPVTFDHRAHVEMAHAMLSHTPFPVVAADYAAGIRRMAARAGKPGAFHATITLAFLALVAERMASAPGADFAAFAAAHPDLFDKRVLDRHYSAERLASPVARATFVLPDRAAA